MGTRDTLLLGRVSGARKLCEDLGSDYSRGLAVRRWAIMCHWLLNRLHKALDAEINHG